MNDADRQALAAIAAQIEALTDHLARLEYLFTPEGKNICNPRNREVVASWR